MEIWIAFLTGLTTGGLSCLAVQGGLLASSIAQEVEQAVAGQSDVPAVRPGIRGKRTGKGVRGGPARDARAAPAPAVSRPVRAGKPIALFLIAKLAAYTLLGFLLGLLGSVLQLSAPVRAVLQFAIGVFMVGTALRMFNVHPIFRYFNLQPPRAVTRYIRRKSKGEVSSVTPLFLGALTVLIPCGVTQAMMAVAMGTGSPLSGAAIMFAFILGTSPVFFAVAYAATRLGERLEAGFMRFVAVVMLALGLVAVNSGLTLVGSPYAFANLRLALSSVTSAAPVAAAAAPGSATAPHAPLLPAGQSAAPTQPLAQSNVPIAPASSTASAASTPSTGSAAAALANITGPAAAGDGNVVTITVKSNGYSPQVSHAKAGQPVKLTLVTDKTYSCARSFVIPSLRIEKVLPPSGTVTIDVPAQKAGSKLYYSCSMGMYSGVIVFDA